MDYNELYEYLRKEKYGEPLQQLPKTFIQEIADFLRIRRKELADASDFFSDDLLKSKKQFENTLSIFRELIRLRKRKILNLVFVASETGIMKRDFSTMLTHEQPLFERLVSAVEDSSRELHQLLNGTTQVANDHKMALVLQPIGEFVDMQGSSMGPFEKGTLINLDTKVADILVAEGKVSLID